MSRQLTRNAGITLVELMIAIAVFAIIIAGVGEAINYGLKAQQMTVLESELLGRLQGKLQEIRTWPWDDPTSSGWPHSGTIDYAIYSPSPITFTYDDIPGNGSIIISNDIDGDPGTTLADARIASGSLPYEGTYDLARVDISYTSEDEVEVSLRTYISRPK